MKHNYILYICLALTVALFLTVVVTQSEDMKPSKSPLTLCLEGMDGRFLSESEEDLLRTTCSELMRKHPEQTILAVQAIQRERLAENTKQQIVEKKRYAESLKQARADTRDCFERFNYLNARYVSGELTSDEKMTVERCEDVVKRFPELRDELIEKREKEQETTKPKGDNQ